MVGRYYFQYNNKLYHHSEGFAMGAPTNAIISEIFLQKLEEIIKFNGPSGCYFRFGDDTIYTVSYTHLDRK